MSTKPDDDDIDMRYVEMMRGFFKELSRDLATGTLRFRDDRGTIQPDGSLLPYPETTAEDRDTTP